MVSSSWGVELNINTLIGESPHSVGVIHNGNPLQSDYFYGGVLDVSPNFLWHFSPKIHVGIMAGGGYTGFVLKKIFATSSVSRGGGHISFGALVRTKTAWGNGVLKFQYFLLNTPNPGGNSLEGNAFSLFFSWGL
jgi:hypothetical protein